MVLPAAMVRRVPSPSCGMRLPVAATFASTSSPMYRLSSNMCFAPFSSRGKVIALTVMGRVSLTKSEL